jgi:hypothetical protein
VSGDGKSDSWRKVLRGLASASVRYSAFGAATGCSRIGFASSSSRTIRSSSINCAMWLASMSIRPRTPLKASVGEDRPPNDSRRIGKSAKSEPPPGSGRAVDQVQRPVFRLRYSQSDRCGEHARRRSPSDIPEGFTIVLESKKIYSCNVVWCMSRRIGVLFCRPIE